MEHENDILTVEKVDKTTDDNWTYVPKKQSSNQTIKQESKEFSYFSHAKKPRKTRLFKIWFVSKIVTKPTKKPSSTKK